MSEFLPGYEVSVWIGVGAPAGTPAEIVNKLNTEINAGLGDAKLKARFDDLGAAPFPQSPTDFRRFVAEETEKWGKVVKFAGLKQ